MKTLLLCGFSVLGAIASFGSDAFEVIGKEGILRFSDGSSIYAFHKDGRFELSPVSISGRTISGTWKRDDSYLVVSGEWSWENGLSQPGDMRLMRIYVLPTDAKETIQDGYRKELVTKVYFTIESIQNQK